MTPYFDDGKGRVIYLGDARDVLPDVEADVLLTDPPWRATDSKIEIRGNGVAPPHQKSTSIGYGTVGTFDPELVRLAMSRVACDAFVLVGYKELAAVASLCDPGGGQGTPPEGDRDRDMRKVC